MSSTQRIAGALKDLPAGTPIEVWFQDKMRVGQKKDLIFPWAKKDTRPRQPKDQRYANACMFGAVFPARHHQSTVILPPYSPELTPQENIWQELRQNHLSACSAPTKPSSTRVAPPGWP